jgi:hypothetical protein
VGLSRPLGAFCVVHGGGPSVGRCDGLLACPEVWTGLNFCGFSFASRRASVTFAITPASFAIYFVRVWSMVSVM